MHWHLKIYWVFKICWFRYYIEGKIKKKHRDWFENKCLLKETVAGKFNLAKYVMQHLNLKTPWRVNFDAVLFLMQLERGCQSLTASKNPTVLCVSLWHPANGKSCTGKHLPSINKMQMAETAECQVAETQRNRFCRKRHCWLLPNSYFIQERKHF